MAGIKVDLRASVVKPLHGNWLMMALASLQLKNDVIKKGFEKSGILEYT